MSIVTGKPAGVKPPANLLDGVPITALPDDSNAATNLATIDLSVQDLLTRIYLLLLDVRREGMLLNNNMFPSVDMDNQRDSSDFSDPYGLDDAV